MTEVNCKAKIETTMDRKKALKGADAVLITVLAGGTQVWRHDIEIPKRFGVDFNIGDTRGVAGIFRALRTIPVMLDICRDIERLCPDAIVLNYTNPIAMICRAMHGRVIRCSCYNTFKTYRNKYLVKKLVPLLPSLFYCPITVLFSESRIV